MLTRKNAYLLLLLALFSQCGDKGNDFPDLEPETKTCRFTYIGSSGGNYYQFNYDHGLGLLTHLSPFSPHKSDQVSFSYDQQNRVTCIAYHNGVDTLKYSKYYYVPGTASWKYAHYKQLPNNENTYDTAFYDGAGQRTLVNRYSEGPRYIYRTRIEMSYLDGNIDEQLETSARLDKVTTDVDSGRVHYWKYKWNAFDNPYKYFEDRYWGDRSLGIQEVIHTPSRQAAASFDIYRYFNNNGTWHMYPESVKNYYTVNQSTGLIQSCFVDGNSQYQSPGGIWLSSECK